MEDPEGLVIQEKVDDVALGPAEPLHILFGRQRPHIPVRVGETHGDVVAERLDLFVIDLVGSDDDAQFASSLDGVGLGDAWVTHGDVLKILQTLDISFGNLAAGTGTCAADGVANLHDRCDEACHFHFLVVCANRIADIRLFLVLLCQLGSIECVRQFGLLVGHLTYIVK